MNKWILIAIASLHIAIQADTTSSLAHAIMNLHVDQVRMLLSSAHLSPEQTEMLLKFAEKRMKAKSKTATLVDIFQLLGGAALCAYCGYKAHEVGATLTPSSAYTKSDFWGSDATSPHYGERNNLLKTLGWGVGSLCGVHYALAGLNCSSSAQVQLQGQQIVLMLLGKAQP